jgi:hypothetical protein
MGEERDIVDRLEAPMPSIPAMRDGASEIRRLRAEILRLRTEALAAKELAKAAQALLDAPFPDEETPAQYVTQMALANLDACDNLRAALSAFTQAKEEGTC